MTNMGVNYANYLETARSNLARETETHRSNVADETERNRSNLAKEAETHRSNVAGENLRGQELQEKVRANKAGEALRSGELSEKVRSAKESESIKRSELGEKQRSNMQNELVNYIKTMTNTAQNVITGSTLANKLVEMGYSRKDADAVMLAAGFGAGKDIGLQDVDTIVSAAGSLLGGAGKFMSGVKSSSKSSGGGSKFNTPKVKPNTRKKGK